MSKRRSPYVVLLLCVVAFAMQAAAPEPAAPTPLPVKPDGPNRPEGEPAQVVPFPTDRRGGGSSGERGRHGIGQHRVVLSR